MQLLRKILKQNLTPLKNVTKDIIISFTEDGSLYVNNQDGTHKKISDLEILNSSDDLATINPNPEKLYVVKGDNPDIKVFDTNKNGFISFRAMFSVQFNQIDASINGLNNSLNEFIETQTTENTSVQNSITELQNSINDTKNSLADSNTNFNRLITDLTNNINTNSQNIQINSSKIDSINSQIETINTQIETINTSINDIQLEIQNINDQQSENNLKIDNLKSSIETNERNIINQGQDIDDLKQFKTTSEPELEKIKERYASVVYNVNDLEVAPLQQLIYVPALVDSFYTKAQIASIIVRSSTVHDSPVSLKMTYIDENEDGTLKDEIDVVTFELEANKCKSTIDLPSETKGRIYNSGMFKIYITNVADNVDDLMILIKFKLF